MTFSLAAIPLPVLIAVPVVGLVAAVGFYEYEKHKKATTAVALQQPVVATPPVAAQGPVSAAAPAVAAASTPYKAFIPTMGSITPRFSTATTPNAVAAASLATPTPTGYMLQAQQQAQQLLASLPNPFPGDPFGINAQVVKAALNQLIATPSPNQFTATLVALKQNGTGPAINAYNVLNRIAQTMAA
jgi:hypothetical protein